MKTPAQSNTRTRVAISRRTVLAGLATAGLAPVAFAQGTEIRITHAFGEAVLPARPTRVVSLGFTTHDTILALGTVPVATRYWFGDQPSGVWPWAAGRLAGAEPVVISGEVGAETIASLQPDLIVAIGSGISEAEYAVLSQIAPTLMQPPGQPVYGTPWDETTRIVARALGREAEAETMIAGTRERFAAVRARHPDWQGRSAVAAYHFAGETGAFTRNDTRGQFLTELGFAPVPEIEELGSGTFYAALSPEDLSALDADLLVWVSSTDAVPDIVALPMRRMLGVHREGREVFAGSMTAAALSFGSILSLPFALEQLEPEIALALDGDPATIVGSTAQAGLTP